MSEEIKSFVISGDNSKPASEKDFTLFPAIPYDPGVSVYAALGNVLYPREYTGWLDETMSWKTTCYIHAGLSMGMARIKLVGPDAERLLSECTVSDFSKMKIGRARHSIFCNKFGHVLSHGMSVRIGQDAFDCYSVEHALRYYVSTNKYDVQPIEVNYDDFVFQIGGPASLQTVENACRKDLHDLAFMNMTEAAIAGHTVRVLRMGMAGTLAYEIHGDIKDAVDVYNAIYASGEQFGIKKLGELLFTYMCNHTENGYPQDCCHFYDAFREDQDFYKWYREKMYPEHPGYHDPWDQGGGIEEMRGTLGDNIIDYYRNPIELGWGNSIHWNHDFIGKEALKKIADNNPRKPVTLLWNAEDVLDVYASYMRTGKPYLFMPWPRGDGEGDFQLKVVNNNGKFIGVTSYRTYTFYSRNNISLCCLDADYAKFGSEVIILWGDKDKHPIKKIRTTVAKFPFLDLVRNENYDIGGIPRYVG
jgi:glycine cleavage system aminomethyltransferase T